MNALALNTQATWRGRNVTIVSRCYVDETWLYGLRLPSGKIVDYVPGRLLKMSVSDGEKS